MFIVYRACSIGNTAKKKILADKYDLVNLCFGSFLRAFKDIDASVVILLDKPTAKFRKIFSGFEVMETFYGGFDEGNTKSFHNQIDLVLSRGQDFMFIEDDYLFKENAGEVIYETLTKHSLPKGFFLTPYDHPGYYTEEAHNYKREVKLWGNYHWQSVISTTLTFAGQYKALRSEANTMKEYGWADHPMWVNITSRIPLFAAMPSLATHTETEFIAPTVDWSLKTSI